MHSIAYVKPTLSKVRHVLARFASDTCGSVAIIMSFAILPILLAVGLAIDFSSTLDARAKLDAAADAAALAGTIEAKAYILAGESTGKTIAVLNSEAITVGQDAAQKFFATSVLKIPRLGATSSVATVTVKNQIIRSTIRYSAVLPLNFGPIIGKDYSDISNIVTAEASLPLFLDIYIALDVSSSMGVGATQEDINIMNAAIGCAFGCHAGSDNYERAHAAGATLRIDVLRSAIAAMLKKAKGIQSSLSSSPDLFRFSIYAFSNRLATLQTPTTDYAVLNQAVSGIEPDRADGGTNFHVAIGQQFAPLLPQSGSGRAGEPRKTHVIIVTDGVEDCATATPYFHCDDQYVNWYGNGPQGPEWSMQAFDPAICQPLKNTGATVSVLNVNYVAPTGIDQRFDYVRNSILPNTTATIGGCASTLGSFYTANSPDEIKAAINSIFGNISSATRLTN